MPLVGLVYFTGYNASNQLEVPSKHFLDSQRSGSGRLVLVHPDFESDHAYWDYLLYHLTMSKVMEYTMRLMIHV